MKYYRNPVNDDIVVHDPESDEVIVCVPLQKMSQQKIGESLSKVFYDDDDIVPTNSAHNRTHKVNSSFVPPLIEEQYGLVRVCKMEDWTAVDTASDLGFPIQQVNFAYMAREYEDYVRLARGMH